MRTVRWPVRSGLPPTTILRIAVFLRSGLAPDFTPSHRRVRNVCSPLVCTLKGPVRLSRRAPIRVSQILAVTILTASFAGAAVATDPARALAASSGQPAAAYTITLQFNTTTSEYATRAATVGDFLRERAVTVGPNDYLAPAVDAPLSDGLVITYRAAVPVTIQVARQRIAAVSSAQDVGALLAEQNIRLGPDDIVHPATADPLPANGVVRVERVVTWLRTRLQPIAPHTIRRLDFSLDPGSSQTLAKGAAGERSVTIRFTRSQDGPIAHRIVASHVIRAPHNRVVAAGADEYQALARFAAHGAERSALLARSAMQMVATAYTAGCAGCSGMTAIGRPAGRGIVAVDPRVIPLGTRLYIPGYGMAVAGDTGGAIHGLRIDLGFNSQREAMLFGRRQVTVYRLK
jgi:3D (Asp-Asp-Asp) domain-containing protein